MKDKHICFIVPNYPTEEDPVYTFVKELVMSIANMGVKCTVIAPQSITNLIYKKHRNREYSWKDFTNLGKEIDIYQPYHAPFISKIFGARFSAKITQWAYHRVLKRIKKVPDILYAHFWHSGIMASGLGNKYNIPVFVATGESKIWVKDFFSEERILDLVKNIRGVIAVSTKNKIESIELGLANKENIEVIPNSVNRNRFYPIDKWKARKELGFKDDDFIIAFTGAFSHRKGIVRLSEAINQLDNIKSIFIGSGKLNPTCDGILHKGKLSHNYINLYLNAADIFVLPTLAEGCSNAIIEAMATGLPIISSDLPFNDDILNDKNSLRIDPNDVSKIAKAIDYLKNRPDLVQEMSKESLLISQGLDINVRAERIVRFIEEMIN